MQQPEPQYAISLKNVKIVNVNYATNDHLSRDVSGELKVNLQYRLSFNEKDAHNYIVEFFIEIEKADKLQLSLKAVALFATQESINKDFKQSSFANLNSPAIAFPYVRSFVTTFSTNAGLDPIILPSFNFANATQNVSKE